MEDSKENRDFISSQRKKMIHDHRHYADSHGPKLPYDIGIFKSKTGTVRDTIFFICNECGEFTERYINRHSYAIPCACGGLFIKQEK